MSEKRSLRGIGGPGKKPTQINEHLNKQKEDDCLKELWRELDDSEDGQEIDPEDFLRNMTILDDLVPLPSQGEDWNLSWKDFEEKYGTLLDGAEPADQQSSVLDPADKSPNCKRPNCKRVVAVFLAVVLVLALLTSCGVLERFINAVAKWTDQIFRFEVATSFSSDIEPEESKTKEYPSLEEAFVHYGIGTDCVPKWPEDFVLDEIYVVDFSESIMIEADYRCGDKRIGFVVWSYMDSDALDFNVAEKDIAIKEIHVCDDREHYIMGNYDQIKAIWIADTEMYTLTGDLSIEDIKEMINSIYER